jgi:hypothetical protein
MKTPVRPGKRRSMIISTNSSESCSFLHGRVRVYLYGKPKWYWVVFYQPQQFILDFFAEDLLRFGCSVRVPNEVVVRHDLRDDPRRLTFFPGLGHFSLPPLEVIGWGIPAILRFQDEHGLETVVGFPVRCGAMVRVRPVHVRSRDPHTLSLDSAC